MKWIIMKYADILVASGDVHFRRGTLEALRLATQRYIEATHVLGEESLQGRHFGDRDSTLEELSRGRDPWTFERLYQEDLKFGVGLPSHPSWSWLRVRLRGETMIGVRRTWSGLITSFFDVPLNPKFRQVRSIIKQRLFNVRNRLDIDGRPISYALIEPSIDPGALVALSV